jgi:hypothetical protein
MIEKRAIGPSIQGFAGHFLEEEEPRGFEDTPNLGYPRGLQEELSAASRLADFMRRKEQKQSIAVAIG